eukprot:486182-Rhodomonas_salina.1
MTPRTSLCACYATSSTDLAYATTRRPDPWPVTLRSIRHADLVGPLSAYVPAVLCPVLATAYDDMRCPVLT